MPITFKPTAVIDAWQLSVITEIEKSALDATYLVSRGHATPQSQLDTIAQYANAEDILDGRFPEFDAHDVSTKVEVTKGWLLYKWQRVWSELLRRYSLNHSDGAKINPPLPAVCLFDYVRDNGDNMKGKTLPASPHIVLLTADPCVQPCPIDFSQMVEGKANINKVHAMLQRAKDAGAPIKDLVIEKANGCVHGDLDRKPSIIHVDQIKMMV